MACLGPCQTSLMEPIFRKIISTVNYFRKNSHDIDTTWCPPPKRWGDFNFRKLKASKEEFFYHRMGSKAIWEAVIKISKGGII